MIWEYVYKLLINLAPKIKFEEDTKEEKKLQNDPGIVLSKYNLISPNKI